MAFKNFLFGSKPQITNLPRLSQGQQALTGAAQGGAQNLLQMLMGNLMSGQGGFAPIAQRARTQFQQQTIPSIAERFTSMGEGAQSSPAFTQALGQAGAGLEEGLAAQESQYGLQQQGLLQALLGNLFNVGLTPEFETLYQPAQGGLLQNLFGAAPQALSTLYGGQNFLQALKALGTQPQIQGPLGRQAGS